MGNEHSDVLYIEEREPHRKINSLLWCRVLPPRTEGPDACFPLYAIYLTILLIFHPLVCYQSCSSVDDVLHRLSTLNSIGNGTNQTWAPSSAIASLGFEFSTTHPSLASSRLTLPPQQTFPELPIPGQQYTESIHCKPPTFRAASLALSHKQPFVSSPSAPMTTRSTNFFLRDLLQHTR